MDANTHGYNGVQRITAEQPPRCLLARLVLRAVGKLLFRVRVEGIEHVPIGNYIVVANHLSWVDPFLLLLFLPPSPRIYIAGAKQAVHDPRQAWWMRWFDLLIPYERGARWIGKHPFDQTLAALNAGASLALFVEGDVGPQEGKLMPICRGVGHFLLRARVPVLPVALSGTRELWWRKPVRIVIGQPFTTALEGSTHHERIAAAVSQVEGALRRLLPLYVEPNPKHRRFYRFLTNLGGPVQGVAFKS